MFNSKFSTGILKHPGYNVGGGVGEAMLIGAAVGGGTALITGEDPLKGALTGGAMGGIGGAMFGGSEAVGATGATGSQMSTGANVLQSQATQAQGTINALNNAVATTSAPTSLGLTTAEINPAAQYYASAVTPTASAVTPATTAATNMYGNLAPDFAPQALDSTIARNLSVVQPAGEEFAKQYAASQAPSLGITQAAATPQSKGLLSQAADWYQARSPMEKVGIGIAGGVGLNAIMNPQKPLELDSEGATPGIFSKFDKDKFERYQATPSVYKPTYAAFAEGGIAGMAGGGMGRNQMYPQALQDSTQYATPSQMPTSAQVVNADYEAKTDPYLGTPIGMASGGIARYADGGSAAPSYSLGDSLALLGMANPSAAATYLSGGASPSYAQTPGVMTPQQLNAYLNGTPTISSVNNTPPVTQSTTSTATPDYTFSAERFQPVVLSGKTSATKIAGPNDPPPLDPYYAKYAGNPGVVYAPYSDNPMSAYQLGQPISVPSYYPAPGTPEYDVWRAEDAAYAAKYGAPLAAKGGLMNSYASGGIAGYNLGGYAAGGNPRLLKGPGDGMSDNIPATIGDKQPARLADGEFVVPADVVSHLGNGSTDAGAKHLYAMMDKVRKARTGSKKQGKEIKADKYLPA